VNRQTGENEMTHEMAREIEKDCWGEYGAAVGLSELHDLLCDCRQQLTDNHTRAEEIIAAREATIAKYQEGIRDILNTVKRVDDLGDAIDPKAWNWLIDRIADL
jgi:uncharacterized protein YnzC (UPF0291/DUF896 family)